MNFINSVNISNLWDRKDIKINLGKNVNFLIGANGCGKTTVINLIAASLKLDFSILDRTPFKKIIINLSELVGKNKSSIEIEKKFTKNHPFPEISYKIKSPTGSKPMTYSLNRYEEERYFRTPPSVHPRRVRQSIIGELHKLISISWLTIHRAPIRTGRSEREASYESTIGSKIDELSNEFVRFFSSLSKLADDETEKFQQSIFLSLLDAINIDTIYSDANKLAIESEKRALTEIFKQIKIKEPKYFELLEKHYASHLEVGEKLEDSEDMPIEFSDFDVIYRSSRLHSIVQEWNSLVKLKKEIMEPQTTFFSVINSLLQGKSLDINEKNELIVKTKYNETLSLNDLSSGEKQLFIFLGETLLQQKSPMTYIADEPELSLHVKWQELLIDSILKVNPNVQIIFATHSPDIVGKYSKNIINLEDF